MTSGGMGTMGYSMAAAMGAVAADPDRLAVAVCGDGSFQMSMMELATMNQYDYPVKIVVFRNNYLGLVREHQHFVYADDYNMVKLGGEPDLKLLSEAYHLNYFRTENMDGLSETLDKFLHTEGTVILEVMIDPMETVVMK